jgi:hypothetical protein
MEKVVLEKKIDPEMDRKIANEPKNIPGWGMDADPENDPTYPMKHWNGADHERIHYEKASQQPVNIEVLKSVERPTLSTVFGTSTPPAGLSGVIRRQAYKYSEATGAHWMTLMLADKIDVIQGIVNDIRHGIFPNFAAELGWRAKWRHDRAKLVTSVAVKVLAIAAVTYWLMRKKKRA